MIYHNKAFPSSFYIKPDVYDTTPETEEQDADASTDHTYNNTQDPKYDQVPDSPIYSDVPGSPSHVKSDAPGSGSGPVYGNVRTETPAEQKCSKQV